MNQEKKYQPELLLPAGNVEAFFAAIEGGANAIYLGLKQFNARNRASNFTAWQIAAMVKMARSKGVKTYLTLNTVIRNFEIGQLLDTLYQISQFKPDAVIVQDLGVQHLAKKFFPELILHASTQMAVHNSLGVEFSGQSGLKRVVLARELTRKEVETIALKSKIELELFVHGALCYSFSGMCLFSSFLGGASANRGLCTQPCRRIFQQGKKKGYTFSLKDNQLIGFLPEFAKEKIASLKIEGRMKSSDYVLRAAKAYRLALDAPEKTNEAIQLLEHDLGREKTSYFYGKEVKNAITQSSSSGLLVGKVDRISGENLLFRSNIPLETGFRLRFRNPHNDKQIDLKIENLSFEDGTYTLPNLQNEIKQGYEVYLTGTRLKLPAKINTDGIKIQEHYPSGKANLAIGSLKVKSKPGKRQLYLRIDRLDWLEFLPFHQIDGLILELPAEEWGKIISDDKIIKQHQSKVIVGLPRFIPEAKIEFYKNLVQKLYAKGLTRFSIGHISQKLILPTGAQFLANENIYMFNDAAIQFIRAQNASEYIYPFENDMANLARGNDRTGLVPLFFYPELFYSRMPVDLENGTLFSDLSGTKYKKTIRNGITIVLPEHPVSLIQYREKIERFGFFKFFIDLKHANPDPVFLKQVIGAFQQSTVIKPSSLFNFKREMK